MTITNVTLTQLRIFAAIAEEGSFSRAAARLGMTQSGASQAIRALETALGAALLARGKNSVAPTELGEEILSDARQAVLALERMQQRCTAAAGLQKGRLRIGAVTSAAARLLPTVLSRFRRLHPSIDLTLMEGTDREVLDWVEAYIVDVGLTAERSEDTNGRVISEDEYVLLVSRDHSLAGAQSVSLTKIAKENFLMSGSGCAPDIMNLFSSVGISPKVILTVRDTAALAAMVEQNLGVTLMPELAVPQGRPSLRQIQTKPRGRRRLLASTSNKVPTLPAADRFIQLLAAMRSGDYR